MNEAKSEGNKRETQGGDGELGRCHICDETFSTQEELSRHLMDEHAEEETLGDSRDAQEPSSNGDGGAAMKTRFLLPILALATVLVGCEDEGNPGNDNLLTGGSLVLVVLVVLLIVFLVRRRR